MRVIISLLIYFPKYNYQIENILNGEAKLSGVYLDGVTHNNYIVNIFKWMNNDIIVMRDRIMYQNQVLIPSGMIYNTRFHLSTKNWNKICYSAQCSHFCNVKNQSFVCSCPDHMVLQDKLNCVAEESINCNPGEMFKCNSGECIIISKKCDGFIDCVDSSDEIDCQTECESNQYLCEDRITCIDILAVCNGMKECPDGSDEKYCHLTPKCSDYEFKCNNFRCIPNHDVCNGVNDCGDFSDEKYCTVSNCTNEQIVCDHHKCIELQHFCNEHFDCDSRIDELKCQKLKVLDKHCAFECNNICLNKSQICDGFVDCEDESDEWNCVIKYECPQLNMLKCRTEYQCYFEGHKCDRFTDCNDGSDEYQCSYKNRCNSSKAMVCQEKYCNDMNEFDAEFNNCNDGNNELISWRDLMIEKSDSPLIINFVHTYTQKTGLHLKWEGIRFITKQKFHISLKDWDTNNFYFHDDNYESKELIVKDIKLCHRYVAEVKLAESKSGRMIQFKTFNQEIKPPSETTFSFRNNKISWKYPDILCIPVTYFIFCYRKETLIVKLFTFDNVLSLESEVDRCDVGHR
ncbi:Low-density lipoprotein receptor-related protein [Thelohanellus kitauei]|uniref:Low-density lipoprotein receptor-related protein n=1 Tax=Thelohanellus kitauei TaxID=669202 RepID=A0A0C2MGE3_THEKT|nr:Low-density lipoprotein receptor-related protein [Thelohanellus kitauei]